VLIELDAHDAPVLAGIDAAGLVALVAVLAVAPIGGRRAPVFECIAVGLEALEGETALFAGLRTEAAHRALLDMDNGV
jgi:hypothetical protein